MCDSRQVLPLRRAVALALLRDAHPWHVLHPPAQRATALRCRVLVAAALPQDILHVVVVVHSAPHVMALAMNGQTPCIQVPRVLGLGTSTLPRMRIVLPTLQTPLTDGCMGDVDPACK